MKYSLVIGLLLSTSVSFAQMNTGDRGTSSTGVGISTTGTGVSTTGVGTSSTGQPIGNTNGGNVINPTPNNSVTAPITPTAGALNANPLIIPNTNSNTRRYNRTKSSSTTSVRCTTSNGVILTQSDTGYTNCVNAAQTRR